MKYKPKPCPLCGTKAIVTRLEMQYIPVEGPIAIYTRKFLWNISCGVKDDDSDTCGLVVFGGHETRKAMVEKWNARAILPEPDQVEVNRALTAAATALEEAAAIVRARIK